MAKFFVATRYTDADGDHEVNDEVEFPRDTAEQKVAVDTLIEYGIISTKKTNTDSSDTGSPFVQPYVQPQG